MDKKIKFPWLLYGVFVIILAMLAFGTHSEDAESKLTSIGIKKQEKRIEYINSSTYNPAIHASRFDAPTIKVPVEQDYYTTNMGSVALLLFDGALLTFAIDKKTS